MNEDKSESKSNDDHGTTERDKKADETLRSEGIDPDAVPDITDPKQWRKMPKEGGGA